MSILAALSATGCGDGATELQDEPTGPQVATVEVTSPVDTLLVLGHTVQMSASAQDATGATISGVQFSWTSSNPQVAAVSSTGVVTAASTGSATITATAGTVDGILGVRVVATDLPAISALLDDPFAHGLVDNLTSGTRLPVQDALDRCASGTEAGNVVTIIECVEAVRGETGSAAEATNRALLTILVFYMEAIERLLNL